MDLAVIVQIGQIIASTGTLIAVGCSIYIANKARREVREDRRLRTHPVVVMQPGGHIVPTNRAKFNYRIPGKEPSVVAEYFRDFPADGLRIDSKAFGIMQNIGQGPAIDVEAVFQPRALKTDEGWIDTDPEILSQPRYSEIWNTEVAMNHVLLAGSETELSGLPCFVTLDFKDEIVEASGMLRIKYKDLTGKSLCTTQEFRYFNSGPHVAHRYGLTFGDIVKIPN
jgi:hypothetical protein